MDPYARIASIAAILPMNRADFAKALHVSPARLYGWLAVARGDELPARHAGRVPPDAEILRRADELRLDHARAVAAA